jgi:hypothetical protein
MEAASAPESTPAAEAAAAMEAASAPESTPAAEAAAAMEAASAPQSTPAAAAAMPAAAKTECRFRSAQAQAKAEHDGAQEHIKAFQQTLRSWRQNNCAGKSLKRALAQNSALNAARPLRTQPRHCSMSFASRRLRFKRSLAGRHLRVYLPSGTLAMIYPSSQRTLRLAAVVTYLDAGTQYSRRLPLAAKIRPLPAA